VKTHGMRLKRETSATGAGATEGFFADPVLELLYLLKQAAAVEHSVALAYLYAAFSVKKQYAHIRGGLNDDSYGLRRIGVRGTKPLTAPTNLLEASIEEMQHLAFVNEVLQAIGAAPEFESYEFPMISDVFPFPIALRSLDLPTVATFLWLEADDSKLAVGRNRTPSSEPVAFVAEVRGQIDRLPDRVDRSSADHFGSVYRTIVRVLERVASAPPAWMPIDTPWDQLIERMQRVLLQGEISHYDMFRSMFTAAAFASDGQPDPRIWSDPWADAYPARALKSGTAWPGHHDTIGPEPVRRLAWLGNLHYWLLLAMLDDASRSTNLKFRYAAVDQMSMALWAVGIELADKHNVGMPFDPIGFSYGLGVNGAMSRGFMVHLAGEAKREAQWLAAEGLLPGAYSGGVLDLALAALGAG
jgi:Ferritin-like